MGKRWQLDEARAADFLREALSPSDRRTLGEETLLSVARHALAVRSAVPWGGTIPEDVFMPFVLVTRVNNEDAVYYHAVLWDAIRPRLEGMDVVRAAMEVNRWCCENAGYRSTDDRTANALTVLRRGFGRCGEESVLLVSALRACGIPARQVYAPLWSHCDDNHAWVEAWADGGWHYMGACEPELALDSGWFTAAASKAMLARTRAWGAALPSGERAEGREGGAWIINRTAAYARTALLTLRVTERGAPRAGLRVDFELANMAAYGVVCRKATDADGRVDFLTGLGTLRVRLTDGARAMEVDADVARQTDYAVDFAEARPFAPGASAYAQRPPRESRMQPADFPEAEAWAHARWLAGAAAAREARFAVPEDTDPLLKLARGNRGVIEAFLNDARFDPADARTLLEGLREKDLADATAEALSDAMEGALPWRDRWPREVWAQGVLCPRVSDEMLRPFRRWARETLPPFDGAQAVWRWLLDHTRLEEPRPEGVMPDMRAALETGVCSRAGRDILFVALCRANGVPARLAPVTGEKQFWDGRAYRPLSGAAAARLRLLNGAGRTLTGGVHFSVSALEDDEYRALDLYGAALEDAMELALPAGRYRAMTAARQIDGSLEGRIVDLELKPGESAEAVLTLPEDRTGEKLLRVPLPPLTATDGRGGPVSLPGALNGRPGIVAVIAPGQEPTEHFLNELLESREALAARGVAVRLVVSHRGEASNEKLRAVLESLPDAACLMEPDAAALVRWRELLNAGELRLPLAVAVGEAGEGLFAFVNYNVGSVMALIGVIDAR